MALISCSTVRTGYNAPGMLLRSSKLRKISTDDPAESQGYTVLYKQSTWGTSWSNSASKEKQLHKSKAIASESLLVSRHESREDDHTPTEHLKAWFLSKKQQELTPDNSTVLSFTMKTPKLSLIKQHTKKHQLDEIFFKTTNHQEAHILSGTTNIHQDKPYLWSTCCRAVALNCITSHCAVVSYCSSHLLITTQLFGTTAQHGVWIFEESALKFNKSASMAPISQNWDPSPSV